VFLAVFALAGAAVAAFILYYEVHDFRPYLPRIEAIYASMDPEDRMPPENVPDFVSKVERRTYASIASRSLLIALRGPMRMGVWHYHSFMLELMLRGISARPRLWRSIATIWCLRAVLGLARRPTSTSVNSQML
jgi:hypothetical protein